MSVYYSVSSCYLGLLPNSRHVDKASSPVREKRKMNAFPAAFLCQFSFSMVEKAAMARDHMRKHEKALHVQRPFFSSYFFDLQLGLSFILFRTGTALLCNSSVPGIINNNSLLSNFQNKYFVYYTKEQKIINNTIINLDV